MRLRRRAPRPWPPLRVVCFLIWQDPETRQLIKAGQLEELVDGHYVFTYLPGARHDGFSPLVQYPEIDGWYPSTTLPAFFVNRVMSRSRPSYGEFRHWIGLDNEGSDTPFEVLVRTGGPRVTDTFHVVDDLTWTQGGRVVSRFLASGVRHVPGAAERLRAWPRVNGLACATNRRIPSILEPF